MGARASKGEEIISWHEEKKKVRARLTKAPPVATLLWNLLGGGEDVLDLGLGLLELVLVEGLDLSDGGDRCLVGHDSGLKCGLAKRE